MDFDIWVFISAWFATVSSWMPFEHTLETDHFSVTGSFNHFLIVIPFG
jgi:hypothetical protein